MSIKRIVASIVFLLGTTVVAFSQSSFTTGTANSDAAAGFGTPYGGPGVYDYAPAYGQYGYVRAYGGSPYVFGYE